MVEAADPDTQQSPDLGSGSAPEAQGSTDPEAGPDPTAPEADTSASDGTPGDADEPKEPAVESDAAHAADRVDTRAGRGASRLGRGWLVGIAAALLLAAGGIGAGGYLALRSHHESQVIARTDAAALKAAVDCVSATQAPDTNAMNASEQKIIDCGTGNFRSQALLYTSMLVQAYQAANIHVQVADVRAAVERNNRDGTIDVLVALRVKVATDQAQNETGYRLRVKMAYAEGQYKISKLDQVTK